MSRAFFRGAAVLLTFKGVPVTFDLVDPWMLTPKRKGWQLAARTHEARNCACQSALDQYARSSQRNRAAKRGPIRRFGRPQ